MTAGYSLIIDNIQGSFRRHSS